MTLPEIPAVAALTAPAVAAGATDASDLDQILADDADIEVHRQAILARHVLDAHPAVQLALSRIAGLTEQLTIEVRLIRNYFGGDL